jgi:hypothetical protein
LTTETISTRLNQPKSSRSTEQKTVTVLWKMLKIVVNSEKITLLYCTSVPNVVLQILIQFLLINKL